MSVSVAPIACTRPSLCRVPALLPATHQRWAAGSPPARAPSSGSCRSHHPAYSPNSPDFGNRIHSVLRENHPEHLTNLLHGWASVSIERLKNKHLEIRHKERKPQTTDNFSKHLRAVRNFSLEAYRSTLRHPMVWHCLTLVQPVRQQQAAAHYACGSLGSRRIRVPAQKAGRFPGTAHGSRAGTGTHRPPPVLSSVRRGRRSNDTHQPALAAQCAPGPNITRFISRSCALANFPAGRPVYL